MFIGKLLNWIFFQFDEVEQIEIRETGETASTV